MALTDRHSELQSLTKFKRAQIAQLKNGVRIELICADTIANLLLSAAADRFTMARSFLSDAMRIRRVRPAMERSSISRSYYGMYHGARALAFLSLEGDDNEGHNELHKGLPEDFPDVEQWRNALKDARLRRNEADYDPYPVGESEFAVIGRTQIGIVTNFLNETESYLRARGCPL